MRFALIAALTFMLASSCTVTDKTPDDDDDDSTSTTSPSTNASVGASGNGTGGAGGGTNANGGNAGANGEVGKMVGFTAAHNAVRQPLGLDDLSWDPVIATVAQAYAEKLASEDCAFYHSSGDYGENLYWSSGFEPTAYDVTDAWASEVADYDYESNSCAPGKMCGHYTQIVWSTTTRLGCGRAVCADSAELWVCNYDPPGNYVGQWPY